jgi:hypothetical protein
MIQDGDVSGAVSLLAIHKGELPEAIEKMAREALYGLSLAHEVTEKIAHRHVTTREEARYLLDALFTH